MDEVLQAGQKKYFFRQWYYCFCQHDVWSSLQEDKLIPCLLFDAIKTITLGKCKTNKTLTTKWSSRFVSWNNRFIHLDWKKISSALFQHHAKQLFRGDDNKNNTTKAFSVSNLHIIISLLRKHSFSKMDHSLNKELCGNNHTTSFVHLVSKHYGSSRVRKDEGIHSLSVESK